MGYVHRGSDAKREIRRAFEGVALGMAEVGAEEIVAVMREDEPEGEIYWDPELGAAYQASAPGEPPAIRTGEYADAFGSEGEVEDRKSTRAATTNDVVSDGPRNSPLWLLLEYGNPRQGPRPHVRPGAQRAARRIRRRVSRGSR